MTRLSISQIPLFATLPAAAQAEVETEMRRSSLSPESVLFREGDAGASLIIILDGEVEVVKAMDTADERLLRVLGPGSFLGEMSLLDRDHMRTASVRTRTTAEIAEMTHDDFHAWLRRNPVLAFELARVLSLRLRETDEAAIRDLRQKNLQLEQAYGELKAAQAQIVEKEKLERELQLAHDIQQSILPRQMPELPGYDFGALMVPARAVGGDFFDFIPVDASNVGIVVADVSDKGMPAALFMALTRSLVRAEASRGASPVEVLRRVNHHLFDMNQAGMFVSVLYGILDNGSGQFSYARAGHELPLLFDANGGAVSLVSGRGQLLGVWPQPVLDEQSVFIPRGGRLLLFTDGVTDAIDAQDEVFGHRRLQTAVAVAEHRSAQDLCQQIFQTVHAYSGSVAQFDDFTLVAVQSVY